MLRPPVEPMLAQAREVVPGRDVLAAGSAAELKYDGYRALVFTPSKPGDPVLIQSRRGAMLQDRFPDLVTAAREQLPGGVVLDGELLVWSGGRLSFEALQRRAVAGPRTARALAAELPAHFVAFDVLEADGQVLMTRSYSERRVLLEGLFADRGLSAPWTLCPMTTSAAVAREWLEEWTEVPGLEGIVTKNLTGTYRPGARGWSKIRRRDSTEAVIGGVTGTLRRPQLLLLGRFDRGRLRAVGRTAPLKEDAARLLSAHLTPAGPGHPWTGVRFTAAWGSREPLHPLLVAPDLVAEVSADTAVDRGVFRHPLRYGRLRLDVAVDDVPRFGDGTEPGAG